MARDMVAVADTDDEDYEGGYDGSEVTYGEDSEDDSECSTCSH